MTETREHTQFGPYLVVRVSGAGGMGRVELALRMDAKDPDVCVIKRLHGALHDEDQEARFRREAQIAARLEHENIARTLRIEKIDGELCIAQEFVEGVNLGRLMRQLGARPLPIVVAVHVVGQVARALGHAHGFGRLGIVHRDVTPENVMLSFAGDVKLIDFGIARSAVDEAVTNLGVVVGRRSYVPPEAWEGTKVDCRGDVLALGVVLWEVLTGRRAEEAAEPTLGDPRELNPDVPPLLEQDCRARDGAGARAPLSDGRRAGGGAGRVRPRGRRSAAGAGQPAWRSASTSSCNGSWSPTTSPRRDFSCAPGAFCQRRRRRPTCAALSPAPPTVAHDRACAHQQTGTQARPLGRGDHRRDRRHLRASACFGRTAARHGRARRRSL